MDTETIEFIDCLTHFFGCAPEVCGDSGLLFSSVSHVCEAHFSILQIDGVSAHPQQQFHISVVTTSGFGFDADMPLRAVGCQIDSLGTGRVLVLTLGEVRLTFQSENGIVKFAHLISSAKTTVNRKGSVK